MQVSTTNRILVCVGWALITVCSVAMVLCLWLWHVNEISNRAMLGITLALSWMALVLSGATFVLQAVTKQHVDS